MIHPRRQFLTLSALVFASTVLKGCIQASESTATNKSDSIKPAAASTEKVWVIGAGVAGLAAARALQSQGFSVTILEGRDRIGGRVWTDTSLGVPVDLGAAWIHGINDNPISKLAKQFQVETRVSDFDSLVLYDQGGRELNSSEYDQIEALIEEIVEELESLKESANPNTSMATAVKQVLAEFELTGTLKRGIDWAIASEIELQYAVNLKEIGLLGWNEDEAFSGDDVLFPQGFRQIVAGLSQGLDIQFNQNVSQIQWDQTGVKITTNQGEMQGNYVIITVPLGVLKQNKIQFIPPLPPTKQKVIQRLAMGTLNKIALKFPQAFWPQTTHYLGYLTEQPSPWIDYLNLLPIANAPVLVGLSRGETARHLETQPESEVISQVMVELRQIFGNRIPDPVATQITRWSSDPWAYGSYSHLPPGTTSEDYDLLAEPVENRLFFAGEATHSTYPSTVHGAFLSGEREAKRILQLGIGL